MNFKHLSALIKARTMEFIRDREVFFWNLLFPLLLVFGFAFAFSGDGAVKFKVVFFDQTENVPAFFETESFQKIVPSADQESDLEKLRLHKIDLALSFSEGKIYFNRESPNSRLAKELVLSKLNEGTQVSNWTTLEATGQAIRYVDWLVPGVIGMNMMFSTLFGVGFVIVRYRKNGVLKRLKATPVTPLTFVTAQAFSRLVIVLLTSVFVFFGANLFLHFLMRGSYGLLLLHTLAAVFCMISIGLVFASRLKSEELTNGILNLITFPMMLLSGVFFSLEGSPDIIQKFSLALPLTHFNEGARKIMLEGAGLDTMGYHTLILAGLGLVMLFIGSRLFKWE